MDDELLSLAEIYALDAVDDAERAGIQQRLEHTDPDTRAEFHQRVAAAHDTLAALAGTDAVAPPDRLRDRIRAIPDDEPRDAGHGNESRAGDVVAMRPPRKRRKILARVAAVAAAVVIAAAGIGVGYSLGHSATGPQRNLQAQILNAPDAALHTADLPGGGTTTLITSVNKDGAVVLLHRADKPPEGKVYQMWLMDPGLKNPRSVGLVNRSDIEPTTTSVIDDVDDAGAFAITVEPDGGSKKPTSKPFSLIKFENK